MQKITLSILLGIVLIAGSIIGARWIINSKKERKPRIQEVVKTVFVDTVNNGTIPIKVPANGNLMAKNRVELYAEVQGVFKKGSKLFKTGQEYSTGQTLIRIDAAEYYASVQAAKSNLYNLITALMPDLQLDYPEHFTKWQGYLSNFDLDKTTPELPEINSEQEKFFITGRGIYSSYYNVKNLEERLAKYRINAPFSGILTQALVTEGTLVRAGQKLGEYIQPDVYELQVAIGKSFADFLKLGENVVLQNLEGTQKYTGKVVRINGSVDLATQTVTAFVEVRGEGLKEGQYLEANLDARNEPNAMNNQIYVVRDTILDLIDVAPIHFTDKSVVLKNVPDGATIEIDRTLLTEVSKPVSGQCDHIGFFDIWSGGRKCA